MLTYIIHIVTGRKAEMRAKPTKPTKPTKPPRRLPAARRGSGGLPRAIVAAISASKILGIRAGARSDHRFIGVWPVVVDGRVFVRSWTLKPDGWYRTFLDDPLGTIQVGERVVRVRAVRVTSPRINDAVEEAYAEKYPTPGSRKYVRGFRAPRRRESTMEFVRR
jgi:hypothetical protein